MKYSNTVPGLANIGDMSVFANKEKQLQSAELSVEQALCLTLFGMHNFPRPLPVFHFAL